MKLNFFSLFKNDGSFKYVDCGVAKTSDPDTRRTNLYLKVTVKK